MIKISLIKTYTKHIVAIALVVSSLLGLISTSVAQNKDSTNAAFFKQFTKTNTQPTGNIAQNPENSTNDSTVSNDPSWIADRLCIALLAFAVLLCAGEILLFLKSKIDQTQILKLLILTLIVFAILFLITAGYNNAQTQTSVGLFGTIAGYLLGRSVPESSSNSTPVPPKNPDPQTL
jgi:hypothetical protein